MVNPSICAAVCGEDATYMFLLSLCFSSALGSIQPLRDILHGVTVERLVQSAPNVANVRRRTNFGHLFNRWAFSNGSLSNTSMAPPAYPRPPRTSESGPSLYRRSPGPFH